MVRAEDHTVITLLQGTVCSLEDNRPSLFVDYQLALANNIHGIPLEYQHLHENVATSPKK